MVQFSPGADIEGPTVASTDLDNALLYNIGGALNGAVRYGVALERHVATQDSGTSYRYRLTSDPHVPDLNGDPIVAFDGVPLSGAPRTWADIWAAVRTSDAIRFLYRRPVGELGLRIRIGAPRYAGAANGQLVKSVVDGITTAFHAHGDPSTARAIAERLATALPLSADEIAALLVDTQRSALGVCPQLLVLRAQGVQCQPQDGRISALRIEIDRSAPTWQLTGQVLRRLASPGCRGREPPLWSEIGDEEVPA